MMAEYIDPVGRAIDYATERLAAAYVAPFGLDRALARAHISHRVTLQLIAGRDPRSVLTNLNALLAKLAEPVRPAKQVKP